MMYDNTEKAESFNTFFTNIGPNTENTIPHNPAIKSERNLRDRKQFNFLMANISRRLQPAHSVSCIVRGGTANINFVHNNRD